MPLIDRASDRPRPCACRIFASLAVCALSGVLSCRDRDGVSPESAAASVAKSDAVVHDPRPIAGPAWRVIDASDRQPIASARVSVSSVLRRFDIGFAPRSTSSLVASKEGTFELPAGLNGEIVAISIEHPGYVPWTFYFDRGPRRSQELPLCREVPIRIRVTNIPEAVRISRLTAIRAVPELDASEPEVVETVAHHQWWGKLAGDAGPPQPDGSFRLGLPAPGTYRLIASADDTHHLLPTRIDLNTVGRGAEVVVTW